jgi:membrane-associated PAP2 superfamily phosphatase
MSSLKARMNPRSAFLIGHLAPVVPATIALLFFENTRLDSKISNWFFDPVTNGFPLRYSSVMELIGHHFLKEVVIMLDAGTVALYVLSFIIPELKRRRRLLLFLSLALTLAPLAVALLKVTSVRHCPWNLTEYGGFAPHLSLFDTPPERLAAGHCFPAGHAAAGFSMLAFYFAGLATGKRWLSVFGLWGGLMAGMVFGMARVAQGAHFVSHTLWSALVCWLVILSVYAVMMIRSPICQEATVDENGHSRTGNDIPD